ncbi:MAG: hypothetical protein M0040_10420 [Actinomycetota bacterium]|nr:hypothetical protein [Actinomycetota bacterium]
MAFGTGALVAAARGDRRVWALHRAALAHGLVPVVPVHALAEAARAVGSATDFERFTVGTEVEVLDRERARVIGSLAEQAGTDSLAGVAVVELAARRLLAVVSDRPHRAAEVSSALGHELVLHLV